MSADAKAGLQHVLGHALLADEHKPAAATQSQLQSHAELLQALSANAQTHLAKLPQEPAPGQLHAQLALQATLATLKGVRASGSGASPTVTSDVWADMDYTESLVNPISR